MFNVYLRKIILPHVTIDSRNSGYGQTVSASSTPTNIVFSSGIGGQTDSWIGGTIIFTSGTYNGMASDIGSESKTGSTLDSVGLTQAFPTVPEAGTSFILYRRGAGTVSYEDKVYQISRHVSTIKFDTVIDGGYDTATINVDGGINKSLNRHAEILGMDVVIEDEKGHRCFRGIVAGINLSTNGGSIDCVGYFRTFGWFQYDTTYGGTSDVTSTKILRDITDANPYMLSSRAIDRSGDWDTAQQALGGIGPVNFAESTISGAEALRKITEMGRLGISVEAVYMLVYNEPIPTLAYTSATIISSDYVLNRDNYEFSQTGFNIKGSLSDTYAMVDTTYNDINNKTFHTPYAVNLTLLQRLGRRTKTLTSNSQSGVSESTSIVKQANQDLQNLITSDQYIIKGYVFRNGMNTRVPPYYIRAGDTVRVETPYGYENVFKNATMNAVEFYVGKTSYDSSSGTLTIFPVNDPKKSEIFAARLKV